MALINPICELMNWAVPGMTADQIKRGLAQMLFANARNLKAGEFVGLVEKPDEGSARAKD